MKLFFELNCENNVWNDHFICKEFVLENKSISLRKPTNSNHIILELQAPPSSSSSSPSKDVPIIVSERTKRDPRLNTSTPIKQQPPAHSSPPDIENVSKLMVLSKLLHNSEWYNGLDAVKQTEVFSEITKLSKVLLEFDADESRKSFSIMDIPAPEKITNILRNMKASIDWKGNIVTDEA